MDKMNVATSRAMVFKHLMLETSNELFAKGFTPVLGPHTVTVSSGTVCVTAQVDEHDQVLVVREGPGAFTTPIPIRRSGACIYDETGLLTVTTAATLLSKSVLEALGR